MTLTVNGQAASPGCYVEGHWGQYGPDHFADQLEGFGIEIDKHDDPRRYRRIARWIEERSPEPAHGPLAGVYHACLEDDDALLMYANDATEGGFWEWWEGEVFLRSYVCSECGRDATKGMMVLVGGAWREVPPVCDFCCDADDPGCFA